MNKDLRTLTISNQLSFEQTAKTDVVFAYLFIFQWALVIAIALLIRPINYIHIYTSLFLGAAISLPPIFLNLQSPGREINGYISSFAQIMYSILLIHVTGGRIESHFHVFGSLAFLSFYRNWRIIFIATALTALDHFIRGVFWPLSVYGTLTASWWRAVEHSAWVLFEDFFLIYLMNIGKSEQNKIAQTQAELEFTLDGVEKIVELRTAELKESQKLLLTKSRMSALGEMAGGVAHEINNPLAVIKLVVAQTKDELILEKPNLKIIDRALAKIDKTGDRIAKIISGLRFVSRDGSNDPFEKVDILELVKNSLEMYMEKFRQKGIKTQLNSSNDISFVECRPVEISQVLMSLIGNSMDAVELLNEKWMQFSLSNENNVVEISITDSGKGIPPEVVKKLFQPFYSTKDIGKGTGLGLSVSLGIAKSHRGDIFLDEASPNTRFVFRLPVNQAINDKKVS